MVRIKLFLSATCLIIQYFTWNITILHAVFVCIKWKRGFMTYMFMVTGRRVIAYEYEQRS